MSAKEVLGQVFKNILVNILAVRCQRKLYPSDDEEWSFNALHHNIIQIRSTFLVY